MHAVPPRYAWHARCYSGAEMAAVDSLIRLIGMQNADSLTLASDQVPKLSKAGAAQPLSMPPIGAAMMDTFVGEVLSPAQADEARAQGAVTVDYGEHVATVKKTATGWAMSFKKRPARRAAAPEPVTAPPPPSPAAPAASPASPTSPASPSVAPQLDRWLARTLAERASDLLVSAGTSARLRLAAGTLVDLAGAPLTDAELHAVLDPFLSDAHRAALAAHGSADLAFTWHDPTASAHADEPPTPTRFRVNVFRHTRGLAAAFRPIRRDAPTLAELNLPASLARLARFPNGLVLVTGPTGSGKSTTLVALVEELGRTDARHVVTLEDPIEYEYRSPRALVHQRELGTHIDSFEAGLRAALRESPDVILLGEMRDRATIAAAITAAETGHLVLSSLHAGNAAMAVERVIDVFPEHQQRQVRAQLAGTLRAVVTQHLLPAHGGSTRLPAVELLVSTAATSSLIRDAKTHQLASAIQTGRDDGMITLDRSLTELCESGAVAYEAAAPLFTTPPAAPPRPRRA